MGYLLAGSRGAIPRAVLAVFGLLCTGLAAQVTPVAGSASHDEIPGFDSHGRRTFPTSRLLVDVTYPRSQKQERFEVTVVQDPASGYSLWHALEGANDRPQDIGVRLRVMKDGRVVVFAEPANLVEFTFGDGLSATVWRRHVATMDGAVSAAVEEIRQGAGLLEERRPLQTTKMIPFLDPQKASWQMWQEFRCEPFQSFCPSSNNSIASITKQDANWRLVLRNRFDVEVILDANFDVVSVKQLTLPPVLPER